jgi:glycosyltransferase involved in cell wall biosynthesis
MSMTTKFSIAMCTYNGARYLKEQLESLASQTRLPDELIICDDSSSDETVEIVRAFAVSAPFAVNLEVNQKTLGSTQNFARAIQLCQGDLIALCDQDDIWLPAKLESIETLFAERSSVGLVFSDAELVDERLQPLGHKLWGQLGFDHERRRLVDNGRALDLLLPGWTVTGATMAFRSKFLPLILDIPNDLPMIHDGWIALIVATVADVAFIDEPLIKYRQHVSQQIGAPDKKSKEEDELKGFAAVRTAMNRRNSYVELIEIGQRVRQRLLDRCEVFECGKALAQLEARLAHLKSRAEMPGGHISRLPTIARELFSGRYSRYSHGIYSAVKDFLA